MRKKPKNLRIGYSFFAKRTFPLFYDGEITPDKEVILDIMAGERAKIISYCPATKKYTLLNLTVESLEAWFKVNEDELLLLQKKLTTGYGQRTGM